MFRRRHRGGEGRKGWREDQEDEKRQRALGNVHNEGNLENIGFSDLNALLLKNTDDSGCLMLFCRDLTLREAAINQIIILQLLAFA